MTNDSQQPETTTSESQGIPMLEVPADIYDEALAFCNARLVEQGRPQIALLPAGESGEGKSCPCGRACGVFVDFISWTRDSSGNGEHHRDGHPTRFVSFFDANAKGIGLTLPIRVKAGGA